ncbi:50S ribosomal protein L23 [Candidatus Sneabacter namystus]|uniref:Large ribosomal subunit protein uL23 n=1 Tax=Candidatus Sneabacter namystus TaxID=2601646 RepID=A0A5C0UJD4_9RICK|nr:50S ribosomal protein L23 [Candidatus Sneabacter namystus]
MNLYDIIRRPLVTEKALKLESEYVDKKKYLFYVSKKTNKKEVEAAVSRIFNVKVIGVNMLNVKGKVKSYKRTLGKRPDMKKAVVTVQKGDTIKEISDIIRQ